MTTKTSEEARELAEKIHRFVHAKAGPRGDAAHEGSCKWFVGRLGKMVASHATAAVETRDKEIAHLRKECERLDADGDKWMKRAAMAEKKLDTVPSAKQFRINNYPSLPDENTPYPARVVDVMLAEYSAAAVERERERCAKIAKEHEEIEHDMGNRQAEFSAARILEAILAAATAEGK